MIITFVSLSIDFIGYIMVVPYLFARFVCLPFVLHFVYVLCLVSVALSLYRNSFFLCLVSVPCKYTKELKGAGKKNTKRKTLAMTFSPIWKS